MDITVESVLKNSFVITCREDQAASFYRYFARESLTPYPIIFYGYTNRAGVYTEFDFKNTNTFNVVRAIVDILCLAKAKDLPYVCIFEDDAFPCNGCKEKWQKALNDLPSDTLLVRFGWNLPLASRTFITENEVYDNWQSTGSHVVLVFKDYYDYSINLLTNKDIFPDRGWVNILDPINDKRDEYQKRVLCIRKPLFSQKNVQGKRSNWHWGTANDGYGTRYFPNKNDFDLSDPEEISGVDTSRLNRIKEGIRFENDTEIQL